MQHVEKGLLTLPQHQGPPYNLVGFLYLSLQFSMLYFFYCCGSVSLFLFWPGRCQVFFSTYTMYEFECFFGIFSYLLIRMKIKQKTYSYQESECYQHTLRSHVRFFLLIDVQSSTLVSSGG